MTRPTNPPPWVGKVPAEAGTFCLRASEPAIYAVEADEKSRDRVTVFDGFASFVSGVDVGDEDAVGAC